MIFAWQKFAPRKWIPINQAQHIWYDITFAITPITKKGTPVMPKLVHPTMPKPKNNLQLKENNVYLIDAF